MTPEEAIYFLKGIQNENADYSMEEAISVLKEIQQYRLIKDATIGEMAEALKEYAEIGTVEECREAVEKQKAKKPVLRNDNGKLRKSCPVCGCFFSPLSRSCPKCGQAIDDNLEGMEEEQNEIN